MARTKRNFKAAVKKTLAVLSSVALLLSCGTMGLFTVNAETTETTASAAVGEPSIIHIYDQKGNDITNNPFVYLDNSNIAGGSTRTVVTAKVTDDKGTPVSTIIYAALDAQPQGTPHVKMEGESSSLGSASVTLYAASYDSKGKETSFKEGTTRLHFAAADGTLYRDVTVVVYKPAKDVKLYWGDKNNQLTLNDDCEDNHAGTMAIENHKVQIYSEFIDKDSTDEMEYHVYDGYFSGFEGGRPTTKAEITEDGLFTPKENGEVTIYAKAKATETSERIVSHADKRITYYDENGDQKSKTLKETVSMPKYIHVIIVKENPAKSLQITNNPEALEAGDTFQLELYKEPTYSGAGFETGATDVIRWESSNKNVATVDSKGLVSAVSKGEVKITAYGENENVYAECDLRVLTKANAVRISPKPITTRIGVSVELDAKMDPDSADEEIVWISSDPSIATVESKTTGQFTNTQTAIVTGISKGTVTITARAKNSGREDNCLVTVDEKVLSDNLTLSSTQGDRIIPVAEDSTLTVYTNNNLYINARLTSEDGIDADDNVVWTVSNNRDNVTTPYSDSKSITIHGSIEGTVTVTASSKANSNITKSFNVNVLKSCDISKSNIVNARGETITKKPLQKGSLLALQADLKIDDNNYPYRHSDSVASWTSSNPDVATIDNNGNVRAIDNGDTIITVTTSSGQKKTANIHVFTTSALILSGGVTAPVDSSSLPTTLINLNNKTFTQSSKQISTIVKDQYKANQSGAECTWTSSDEEVAVVSDKGVITAVGVGSTIVTAKSGVVEASCLVTVTVPIDNVRTTLGEIPSYTYSPLIPEYSPTPIITVDDKVLTEGVDYTLEYKNNTHAYNGNSDASITITGIGYYTGSKIITYRIYPKEISGTDFTVAAIEDQKCTGSDIKPGVQIECLGTPLEENVDYTLTYSNNRKPTTVESPAIVKIKGKGNYTGEYTTTFNIYCNHEELINVTVVEKPEYEKNGIQRGTCKICGEKVETVIPYTGIYGDIDNSGKVDSADALLILRYSVKLETLNDYQLVLADVDQDGSITSADSLAALRFSVGLTDAGTVTGKTEVNFNKK